MLSNKKLSKELLKEHKHQEIVVTGSRFFTLLELVGFWLHIIAFVIGVLTISGLAINYMSDLTHYLEIITMLIVGLIIVQYLTFPFMERVYLRALLNDFWGENQIATSLKYPLEVDIANNFGTVTKHYESFQIETTKIQWTVVRKFPLKKVMTIQQVSPVTSKRWKKYQDKDKTLNTAMIPSYIIIDRKQKTIKFNAGVNILYTKYKFPEKRVVFAFSYKHKKAVWAGKFPEYPLYGEWIWDKKLADKIAKTNQGKKNEHKKNSKAVSKIVKKK